MLKFIKTKLVPILLAGALAATIVPSAMLAFDDNESMAGAATEEAAETETENTAETDAEAEAETDGESSDALTDNESEDTENAEDEVETDAEAEAESDAEAETDADADTDAETDAETEEETSDTTDDGESTAAVTEEAEEASETEETSEVAETSEAEEVVALEEEADVETDEEILDASTAAYFEENIDTKYTDYEKFEIANFMIVKQTIADKSYMNGEKTIDALYESEDSMYAMITTIPAEVSVYDLSDESDYYVAYANTMINDSEYEVTDAVFAVYNNDGETVDGCFYDYDTGLAYIPKDLYVVDGETYAEYIQVQFLQVTKEEVADMESSVEVSLDDGESVECGEGSVSAFSFETSVETEAGLDTDDMVVTVNGIPTDDFTYDSTTGVVTVDESSLAVQSISVKTNEDESLVSKIKDAVSVVTEEASAETTYTKKEMNTLGTVSLTNIETSDLPGEYFKGNIGVYCTSNDYTQPPNTSTKYTYYPVSNKVYSVKDLLDDDYSNIVSGSMYQLSDLSTYVVNFGMDFEEATFKRKTLSSNFTVSSATGKISVESVKTNVAAYCTHIADSSHHPNEYIGSDNVKRYNALVNSGASASGGSGDSWGTEAAILRVLSIVTDGSTKYMIVGVLTDTVYSQQGYGIFKFKIEENDINPEVALAVYKMSSDTTDDTKGLKGTTYKVGTEYSSSTGKITGKVSGDGLEANQNSGTNGVRIKWKSKTLTDLETGTYYIKETSVPSGYTKSSYVYKLTYQIKKQSSGYYKYTVTAKRSTASGTFRKYNNADLQFINSKVKNAGGTKGAGTYQLTTYFKISGDYYKLKGGETVKISNKNALGVTISFQNAPVDEYGYLDVYKESSNTSITDDNECYSLAGAEYLVYSDEDCTTRAKNAAGNTFSFVMDEDGNSTNGPAKIDLDGEDEVTLYIKESEENYGTGYCLDETVYPVTVDSDSSSSDPVCKGMTNTPASDPLTIFLQKTSAKGDDSDFGLSGAVYKISYYDTTDASADLSDEEEAAYWYLETDDDGYILFDESHLASGYDSSDFYYNEGGLPCIPIGRITVQEVVAPDGFYLDENVYTATITQTSSDTATLTWDDTGSDAALDVSDSAGIAVHLEAVKPTMDTLAADTGTGSHVGTAAEDASVVDTVTYKWLDTGTTYVLKSELVDTEGNVYGTAETEFTVTDEDGCGTVTTSEIVFDATGLGGVTLYVNEYLYVSGEEKALFIHDSAASLDEDQSITFIDVHTTASDITTDEKEGTATEDAQIVDDVECSGLIAGKSYTLTGTVHYKEDFTDANGNTHQAGDEVDATLVEAYYGDNSLEIEDGQVTFTAEDDEAVIRMVYSVDGSLLTGAGVVVFEDVIYDGVTVATHADLTDEDQSVYYPSVKTKAMDKKTETQTGVVAGSDTIIDTVVCRNLTAGNTYRLEATYVDAEGNEYGSTYYEFEATASSMEVTMPGITLKSQKLSGETLYVNELLYRLKTDEESGKEEKILLVEHDSASLEDEDQAIWYPDVHTTATDVNTGTHYGTVGETVQVSDAVECTNLIVGKKYTLSGTLHYKKTFTDANGNKHEKGDKISGTLVKATTGGKSLTIENNEAVFKATKKNMTVTLIYEVDSSKLAGSTVVVFETLKNNGAEVAIHADLSDDDQTVYYPKIGTTATDANTGSHVGTAGKTTIVDKVSYENLEPGAYYTVYGWLMNQKTGAELKTADGELFTAIKTFKASAAGKGTVKLEYKLDASALDDTSVVVFEELYTGEVTDTSDLTAVVTHKDIDDEGQTVTFDTPPTGKTGDTNMPWIYGGIAAALAAAIAVLAARRRRKNRRIL